MYSNVVRMHPGARTESGGDKSGALRADGLSKVFGNLLVIDSISFEIRAGEIVSIVGQSGCGKSTMLRLIAGIDSASDGRVFADGVEILGPSVDRILLFQDDGLFPWRTLFRNVAYGLELAGHNKEQRQAAVHAMLRRVGLEPFAAYYPHQLSGGMRQRAALARALVMEPAVLLMDEPFGALDAITRMKMQRMLLDLWAGSAQTIVLVTHDIDEALYLSDRVLVLSERPGRIIDDLSVDMPRPRSRTDQDYDLLRQRLLEGLGLGGEDDLEERRSALQFRSSMTHRGRLSSGR